MIDFEQEIERRLRHFQWLTGKGNVKDSNHTLYEIIRLMLGMIQQNKSAPLSNHDFAQQMVQAGLIHNTDEPTDESTDEPTAELEKFGLYEPAEDHHEDESSSDEDTVEITSEALNHPSNPDFAPPPPIKKKPVNAPLGLTRAGNPKRDRSKSRKRAGH